MGVLPLAALQEGQSRKRQFVVPHASQRAALMAPFSQRRDKLVRRFAEEGIDALLITSVSNVTYLTGFTGDSSFLILTKDRAAGQRSALHATDRRRVRGPGHPHSAPRPEIARGRR